MGDWTRRKFLKAATVAAGTLVVSDALALDLLAPVDDPLGAYPYRGWETFYRDQYDFDYFGRTTHSVNCTGSCTWKGYVKNDILFKEEQFSDYPDINPATLPTYNPRGCQKGANHKEYVYGPQRMKYPLIRTGARGEGKWRKASWNEALGLIADRMVANIDAHGPDTLTYFAAIPAKHHMTLAGGFRLANLTGGVVCSFYDWYCDLPPGEPLTWGVQTDACESADWYNSNYIMVMGANILETRIPDAHFLTEAKSRGCKIVVVSPEYNATSIHADQYVQIEPGTDGALCLGMANVMVNQNLYDAPYIKQFTDMPILVRRDNGKFLRVSDDPTDPDYNKYYMWDNTSNSAVLAPGTQGTPGTLDLLNVALEGEFTVGTVAVAPVFQHLTEKLADYSPAAVSAITGISSAVITQLAQEFAATKPARIIEGAGTNHYYHNDLINRAQILLVALTGNVGKPGGGFDHYVGQEKLWAEEGFFELSFPIGRPKQRFQNTTLWTYVHSNVVSDVDELWPRGIQEYIQESVDNGWMPLWPKDTLTTGRSPKVLFVWGANYLNQAKGFQDVLNNLWPKLDLIVSVNQRMDTTSLYADVVLPAASMFEKWDLSTTDLHTYVHPFTPVIEPEFDSKTDWQIWRELAGALQATGYSFSDTVPDGSTITRDFSTLQTDFDDDGHGGSLANDRDVAQFLLDHSPETNGLTIQSDTGPNSIIEHPRRFVATGEEWTSDIIDGVAYYGFQRMYDNKRPLTTQTGRQQFYIDHDWFVNEFAEQLPVHKGPIDVDTYPLRWVTPHGRWSIHTSWRDSTFQLRHQRGRPIVYLSEAEATARDLVDNDLVRVFNGHGSMQAHLCISNRMPGELALMYHGWETYTMNDNYQSPTNIRIKPSQLIGMKQDGVRYGHVNFRLNYWGATGNQKDTRVQIEKVV